MPEGKKLHQVSRFQAGSMTENSKRVTNMTLTLMLFFMDDRKRNILQNMSNFSPGIEPDMQLTVDDDIAHLAKILFLTNLIYSPHLQSRLIIICKKIWISLLKNQILVVSAGIFWTRSINIVLIFVSNFVNHLADSALTYNYTDATNMS